MGRGRLCCGGPVGRKAGLGLVDELVVEFEAAVGQEQVDAIAGFVVDGHGVRAGGEFVVLLELNGAAPAHRLS